MIERERFEAWARQRWAHPEDFDQRIKAPSKYNNYEVQAAWEAWQERAAHPAPSVPEGASFIDTSQLAGVVSTEIVHSYPPPSGWLRAIDEALVVTHLGVANASDTYEQAKAKLDSLLGFHVDVATDPAVNGGWKLVPVESTKKMVKACAYMLEYGGNSPQRIWAVMLAAAPEAKP